MCAFFSWIQDDIILYRSDDMDNGYNEWLEIKMINKGKRKKLLTRGFIIIFIILILIFFFGYDKPLLDGQKLSEFGSAAIGIIILFLLVTYLIYPSLKFVPRCNKCGKKIRSLDKDCDILTTTLLGVKERTEYDKMKKTIKGKTQYHRGGYSRRVSEYEYSSESAYEVEDIVPKKVKYYEYKIIYGCKRCHQEFKYDIKESKTKLKER